MPRAGFNIELELWTNIVFLLFIFI
jgi:hypothetical protein